MKKARAVIAVLTLVLVLGLVTSVFAETNETDESESNGNDTTITILHTNDVHGRFVPSGSVMGIDTVAAIYAATENAILVDAGDTLHGLPFVNLGRGENAVALMNMAGYSFLAPGNHEFNYGTDRLLELEEMADFGFLAANIFYGGELLFDAYSIVEIDGVTVGFLGLTNPNTYTLTNPDNIVGLTFGCPVEAAELAVASLQEAGVDVIVAIAHLGSDVAGVRRGDDLAVHLAEAVPALDVIIDGHSHTAHAAGLEVNGVLIAQSGAHGAYLGKVDIVVADGEIVSIVATLISAEYAQENFTPCEDVAAAIAEMQAELDEVLNVVIAYSPVFLYGHVSDQPALRSSEVPIGNLAADAILYGTGADIALQNGGGIRDDLPAGDVTIGDMIAIFPFGNYVVTLEITAAQLWEVMEHSVSRLPNGAFLQIAGFYIVFDEEAPEGSRIASINFNGQYLSPDDNETTILAALNNFLANGGDGYALFAEMERVMEFGNLEDMLIAYMAVADLTAVQVEGRIVNIPGLLDGADDADEDEDDDDTPPPTADLRPIETVAVREVNGVLFVSFRAVAVAYNLEAYLAWNGATQTVTLQGVYFTVEESGGFNDNGRIYVPFDFAYDFIYG